MAVINKNDLKQLSNSTFYDNTVGGIRPQDVRFFNDTFIDSLVDETGYSIDSGSWNAAIVGLGNAITNIVSNTGSYVTNSQTASMSVATASYVSILGKDIIVNYSQGNIELTGSSGNSQVIVSSSAPSPSSLPSGTLWFNDIDTSMYVNYYDGATYQWVGISSAGPLESASYATSSSRSEFAQQSVSASYFFTSSVTSASLSQRALTASYFITSSVTSASRADLATEALWFYTASVTNATYAVSSSWAGRINVTGSGIGVNWYFDELQLTGSNGGTQVFQGDTPPTSAEVTTGSLWYNTTNGGLYVMYVDQDSSQWVSINAIGPVASASYARSSSLATTASWINVTGSGVIANWYGSQLQLTGSNDSQVIISDFAPTGVEEGQQWFNSVDTTMYVYYSGSWVGISSAGPVVSSSYSITSTNSITASSALYAQSGGNQGLQSVTTFGNTTSQSIDIRDRLIVNITGSGTLTQGKSVEARGDFSHAQGYDTLADGDHSHAEGDSTSAYGESSHAEGSGTVTIDAFSHAEGEGSVADGVGSHAEGYGTRTVGRGSHAEGTFTLAEGNFSHAEGENTHAIGRSSNASGLGTVTQGIASNTQGRYTNAREDYQSVVGQWNIPLDGTDKRSWFIIGDGNGQAGDPKELHNLFTAGDGRIIISGTLDISGSILGISASGGPQTPYIAGPGIVINDYQISASVLTVNGIAPINGNIATSLTNVVVGLSGSLIQSSSGIVTGSILEGTVWVVAGETGSASGSNGLSYIWDGQEPGSWLPLASTDQAAMDVRYVIQSPSTLFQGTASLATRALTASFYNELDTLQSVTTRGNHTTRSVIIGNVFSTANGVNSFSQGISNQANGVGSHAEGSNTRANGQNSHAEGLLTTAVGTYSHAEGSSTNAIGNSSHAEGVGNIANGDNSHAEGNFTSAFGVGSHAEGDRTVANGNYSHAEGTLTRANGIYSHAEGIEVITIGSSSHAEGWLTTAVGTYSHAEGLLTIAIGTGSHAEGISTNALGTNSHTEGDSTIASGTVSHAEGSSTNAIGNSSHAEGEATIANGPGSHAEGIYSVTNGSYSHAEGDSTIAGGSYSHAEGARGVTNGEYSHVEGGDCVANGPYSHAEGGGTRTFGIAAHAEGETSIAIGDYSHVEGRYTTSNAHWSHAEGIYSISNAQYSHAEGQSTITNGVASHAEGIVTTAIGPYSHAEGGGSVANGTGGHAEGEYCVTNNNYAHAEGSLTQGNGRYSHAEGRQTTSVGFYSHAEGEQNISNGQSSHAEGIVTIANGACSHAEGAGTTSNGLASHAEGEYSVTNGKYSHAEGQHTITNSDYQHTQGQWNLPVSGNAAFIIGNGTSNSNRSNLLFAVNNKVEITGSLTVTGGITGSLFGSITSASLAQTSSNALSASYVLLEQVAANGNYGNDTVAAAAGVPIGGLYRNGNFIQIRIS